MTDEERDPESAAGAEGTTDQPADEAAEVLETPAGADEPAEDEQLDEPEGDEEDEADDEDELEDEADEEDELADEAAAPVGAAAAAGAAAADTRRAPRGTPPRKTTAAPTVSEQAVRVDDRASAIFVLGVVGVFVAIFVLALLFGYGSFFGNVFKGATPVPTIEVTAAPSESAAASPSASVSIAPSESVAASPAASQSAAPSASPAAPSPSPSAS